MGLLWLSLALCCACAPSGVRAVRRAGAPARPASPLAAMCGEEAPPSAPSWAEVQAALSGDGAPAGICALYRALFCVRQAAPSTGEAGRVCVAGGGGSHRDELL